MITAIKANNVEAYKLLFEEASDILSGYERVQTYDSDKLYYYKDANTKGYNLFVFEKEDEADRLVEFANALVEYKVMYTPIINPETGKPKGAVKGFAPELGITTLEEYFNWLPDLKRDVEGKPTKYTILPLDEAHFVINANTRAINIPADFKKNGIAVQGDDLAEVIYFEIDRYFDAMDLNNCEIYIQWETPRKADGTIVKSVSDVYIRDIESQPGKLIFGWAISDAITEASGNLKFSVKFLQWDENTEGKRTIAYSLNTLTAQVAIHQSIGLNMEKDEYVVDNANDRLLERIQESEVVGGLQAAIPYFLENIEELEDGYDIIPHADGSLKIYAVATADDTGAVSYVWKKRNLKEDNSSEEAELEISNTVTEMVAINEKGIYPVLKEGHVYYLDAEKDIPYTGGKTLEGLKEAYPNQEAVPVFYEKKAMLEVKDAGIYTVEARNRIFNSISKARSKSAVFKRPEPIGIDNSKETSYNHIVGEQTAVLNPPYNETAVGDVLYQWYKAPEKNLISEKFRFFDLPVGGEVSYSDKFVRILCPTNPNVYYEQNVGEGGRKDRFYITMRNYAPKDAVSLRMNEVNNLSKDPDPVITGAEELQILKDKAGYGKEGEKEYFNFWIHIAGYSNGAWKAWSTGKGDNEFIGYRYIIEWYDKDMNVIDTSFIAIQLANEDNFDAIENFQAIETGTEKAYVASDEGLYKVNITRIRNNRSISENSIEYRVTEAPKTPIFAEGVFEADEKLSAKELNEGKYFTVKMDDSIKFDEYEITWMFYRQDVAGYTGSDVEIYKELVTTTSSNFNPILERFDEVFEKHGIKDRDGSYYALVRTKRNGVYSDSTARPEYGKMFVVTGYEESASEEE